jgi:D-galactarolactone isomerase
MTTSPSGFAPRAGASVPAGACDCHIHVYGPRDAYPLAPTSPFDPPLATPEDYRKLMRELGIDRVVLVQPAGYGTDNRCMVDALGVLGPIARGIATVTSQTSDAELERLTKAGVRGARVLLFPARLVAAGDIPALAARIKPFGWHVQLQLDGRTLPEHEAMLTALPVPLVIDHNGKFIEPVATDHPAFRTLLRLLSSGRCWVKASAPYETSKSGPPDYPDVGALAGALIEAAPARVVWASNWPHGAVKGTKHDTHRLFRLLKQWAPDAKMRARILVDNPAELYGFT